MIWIVFYSAFVSATCSLPEMEKEIEKRAKPESPIHDCRLDFKAALRCCIHPEQCKLPPAPTDRQQAENEFALCKKHVTSARKSCRNDHRHSEIIKEDFRRILNCADSRIADMNGQAIKSAGDQRRQMAPPPSRANEDYTDSGVNNLPQMPPIPGIDGIPPTAPMGTPPPEGTAGGPPGH